MHTQLSSLNSRQYSTLVGTGSGSCVQDLQVREHPSVPAIIQKVLYLLHSSFGACVAAPEQRSWDTRVRRRSFVDE